MIALDQLFAWAGAHVGEIIAICALTFTAWQAYVERRHNVLSTTPHLTTFTAENRGKGVGELRLQLMNNGLGPAFIRKFQVYRSNAPCDVRAAIDTLLHGLSVTGRSITTLGDDYAMPSGESRDLLVVTFACQTEKEFETVKSRVNELDLELHYASAYGKEFVYDSRRTKAAN